MSIRSLFATIFLLILLAACGSGEENDLSQLGTPIVTRGVAVTTGPTLQVALPTPSASPAPPGPSPEASELPATLEPSSGNILAHGEFDLPAADAFGDPGFHEGFNVAHTLPSDLEMDANARLVVALWDVDRPDQTCSRDHPLSGCATVDWSDAPSRPNVPQAGVFDNSLTLKLESGTRVYFLSESGQLADEPDEYDPG